MLYAGLALLAGLLYPLAFSPYDLWPALLVSIAAGYACLTRASTARHAFAIGWSYGFGVFAFGISWVHVSMHDYGYMPMWMAVPATAGFAAFLALFTGLVFLGSARLGKTPWVFASLWLVIDWVRGWFLTGFPWLYAGYAFVDTPLVSLAPFGGVWLLTLIALFIATVPVAMLAHKHRYNLKVAAATLALVLLSVVLPTSLFTQPSGPQQNVALAQGNIPQDIKWQLDMRERTRQIYSELTEKVAHDTLVIWPESAITEFYQDAEHWLSYQGLRVESRGGAFISGVPWRRVTPDNVLYHNSIAVMGDQTQVYHKQKLVPFGEYVPLQSLLRGLIPFFDLPMYGFTPGQPDQDNLHTLGHTLAPFICYEILYPALVARRSIDADVLITISNDAWFGTSAGPLQHLQMARLRAAETGRWLLRGTNNGVTAIIDHRGKVVDRLPQFERDILVGSYQPRHGTTPFMILGVWPWLLLSGLCIGSAGYPLYRRRRQ